MTVKLYVLPSNTSSRKVKKYLDDNELDYSIQNMKHEPLSWRQLVEVLACSESGVYDIIAEKSKFYLEYTAQGKSIDDISLIDFYYLVKDNPTLLRAPIMVHRGITMVGYKDEYMSQLDGREKREEEFLKVLETVREYESREIEDVVENQEVDEPQIEQEDVLSLD